MIPEGSRQLESFTDGLHSLGQKRLLDYAGKGGNGCADGQNVDPRIPQSREHRPGNGWLFPKMRTEDGNDSHGRMVDHLPYTHEGLKPVENLYSFF